MPTPNVCVLRAPGTNCDSETAHAFELCGARAERIHLFQLLEQPARLRDFQILCVPGGFSYGDDIGAGVIFAKQLSVRLGEMLADFLSSDKLALGICNGFQVLLKAGLLTGDGGTGSSNDAGDPSVTLTWNDNGRYTAVWVGLKVVNPHNVFLRGLDTLELPVAHAEGKIIVRDDSMLQEWRQNGQLALCYQSRPSAASAGRLAERSVASSSPGSGTETVLAYPDNPNGSVGNIAGLSNSTGRVLGMMPHPERFLHATQHPQWTRRGLRGEGDGLRIFRNGVDYFAG